MEMEYLSRMVLYVDNKENRKKKRGRAVLIDNGVYYVVGDDGVQRKL